MGPVRVPICIYGTIYIYIYIYISLSLSLSLSLSILFQININICRYRINCFALDVIRNASHRPGPVQGAVDDECGSGKGLCLLWKRFCVSAKRRARGARDKRKRH